MVYTEEQKAAALEAFDERGIWAACEESGAHHTTIYRWHVERVRSQEKTPETEAAEQAEADALRGHLRKRLMQTALAQVDRVDTADDGRQAQAFATAAGILMDKFRLEMGESTSREERIEAPSKQVAAKMDELAERREKREAG